MKFGQVTLDSKDILNKNEQEMVSISLPCFFKRPKQGICLSDYDEAFDI